MWNVKRRSLPGCGWVAAAVALLIAGCGGGSGASPEGQPQALQLKGDNRPDKNILEIRTVNNRADLVSDGDALVELVLPERAALPSLTVTLNGRDVRSAFTTRADGRVLGLLTGLAEGPNVVFAAVGGGKSAQLTITNASRNGPLYSGPQVVPYFCATPVPQPTSGSGTVATPATNASGLSGQPGAQCQIATETRLYYRSNAAGCTLALPDPSPAMAPNATAPGAVTVPANPCFRPYDAAAPRPADMATATTDTGATVDYIVRLERGTINRGIYDIAVLYDPARPWTPTAPQPQWNGKVYYNFGASTGQPRRQARPATAWSSLDAQIGRGWAVAVNSMTDSARNSNRVLMTETVLMMKERIGDSLGPIRYTMGAGCSGGSINSNMSASIVPGLLDGITTTCTYPDSETTTLEVGDCVLLVEAYQKPQMLAKWATLGLSQGAINARKAAINGHPDQSACHGWYNAFGSNGRAGVYQQRLVANNTTGAIVQQPTATNNCEMPNSAVYNPADPSTANRPRCNAWSWAEPVWGRAGDGSGAAQDTRDNVGVQYGLKALQDGAITPEEFVLLNELVGGIDRDSTPRAARTTADTAALETAYRAGIVASGRQLAKTPIIDLRGWDDSNVNTPPGITPGTNAIPIHHQWFSFAIRDRITAGYGDAGNQALWRFARTGLTPPGTMAQDAFLAMDQWLGALVSDTSNTPIEQKVRNTRPASTADFCVLPGDATQSSRITDQAVCDADPFLRPSLSPRQVAGGPRSEDVLKCALKPLSMADYGGQAFSADQWSRLQAVFPSGVCDWSKPGIGQQAALSPLDFSAGPGGVPFGPAPVSSFAPR
ncbi:MAG TPA: DUF6351 family protein [Ramlibacter sp.]|jgi:hypothetical protein|uniref:DUF6351 family protein n=1 Tax=Ramlibacter sp. TaxID=1917967 RepID=UPI002D5240D6|nr:DUF6351 family protein [Ramlibacter sp.]HZY17094.1 DUF6351 family protein [Ramlibacter sp.]